MNPTPFATGRGSTLVEVLIALGLLTALLVSVAGLMLAGNRQAVAGAHASQALALAQTVIEQLESRSFRQSWKSLGCDGAAVECRVAADRPAVAAWRRVAERDLPLPAVRVTLVALGGDSLETAGLLRVTVTVSWREGPRPRRLRLGTLRV